MKKITALILTLAMLLSLAACATVVKVTPTPIPDDAAVSAEPSPEPTPEPTPTPEPAGPSAIIVPNNDGGEYNSDTGTLLLSWSCVTPIVTLRNAPQAVADKINAELWDENDFYYENDYDGDDDDPNDFDDSLSSWLDAAKQQYNDWGEDSWYVNYSFNRSYYVKRCDERVLSFSFSNDSYTGGVHGYYYTDALNFDLATGDELELEDIAIDEASFKRFCVDRIIYLCNTEYDENMFFEGFEEYVPDVVDDDYWYFDANGINFVANPYQLASYAAGMQIFTIPYADLADYVRPEYFPADTVKRGSISGQLKENPSTSLEPELVIDADTNGRGQAFVFSVTGTVYDVRITSISYGGDYAPTSELWYASRLDDGDSFELLAWIPDTIPNLSLSYTSAGGDVSVAISQSGKDGSLLLLGE